jgi:hypothetical protein
MSIFPVPANNELNIELDNIEDYQVALYNSIGQTIKLPTATKEINKLTLNTNTLSDGLYFIDFTKNGVRDTRKIIVKH